MSIQFSGMEAAKRFFRSRKSAGSGNQLGLGMSTRCFRYFGRPEFIADVMMQASCGRRAHSQVWPIRQ